MTTQIASKNLYDLLGNDPELDPDREPEPPTKAVDKPVQRSGKRNAGAEGPARDTPRPAAGGRGGRDAAFAGGHTQPTQNNRAERRDDGLRQDRHPDRTREPREHRDIGNRGRGGRGGRGTSYRGTRTARDDRHNHSGVGDHEKQAAHGWGGVKDGQGELEDEQAGEKIAEAEAKDQPGLTPDTGAADPAFSNGPDGEVGENEAPAEPEDKQMSYDQYLASLAEKRMALGGESLQVRKANEGSKQKFPEGTAVQREEQNFFIGSGGKQRRQREAKEKERVELEGQYYAAPDQDRGSRGGRGRGEGSRGRGEGRGRGRGEGRGRGAPRGERGGYRGDRGDRGDRPSRAGGPVNTSDESAFPSLGGK